MQGRRKRNYIFKLLKGKNFKAEGGTVISKVLKEKNWQPRILYPPKVFYRNEGEIKIFSNKTWKICNQIYTARNIKGSSLVKRKSDTNRNIDLYKESMTEMIKMQVAH